MGVEASKKKKHEPIIIEILAYPNLNKALSEIIIPFSEVIGASNVPDVYEGYEKIPFEKRHPLYQSMMRQEFGSAMRISNKGTKIKVK